MRVLIAHQALTADAGADEQDVRTQVALVAQALNALGHSVEALEVDAGLLSHPEVLLRQAPDLVFNLVESLNGRDRWMPLFTLWLDGLGVPYTGTRTTRLLQFNDKVRAKELFEACGLQCARWCVPDNTPEPDHQQWIIKARFEHASRGLHDDAVVKYDKPDVLDAAMNTMRRRIGEPVFAEHFLEGREVNVGLLASGEEVEVLPMAEIEFSSLPAGMPHIVGYEAKWDMESAHYAATPRRWLTDEPEFCAALRTAARRIWDVGQLHGYARVDFRTDASGVLHVLEVNANPCLSPDAGYMAAAATGGLNVQDVVARIIADVGVDL